jgi:hypothetical protein
MEMVHPHYHSHFSPSICNFVDVLKFTLQNNSPLFLLFEHYMFRFQLAAIIRCKIVQETAASLSRSYTLHFKRVKYL